MSATPSKTTTSQQQREVNADLARERAHATIDLDALKSFIGEQIYFTREKHQLALKYRIYIYIYIYICLRPPASSFRLENYD
jgi:hypothetical protein